ncbi:MAG: hypothetical protein ACPGSB_01610, partial [Opitutales bacterium]
MTKFSTILVAAAAVLLFSGCEKAEPVTYNIPKEERNVGIPESAGTPDPAPGAGSMQVLPGMAEAAE